ncbi:MAG TPA: long-chain fatty acid--CoA ligase [Vicinamibacterales bacterium]|nr:long-chain fatty acid--CoA ligase [Vicinamibacterales bacterium]
MGTDGPRTLAELPFFTSGRYPRPTLIGRAGASGITWTSGRDLVERVRDLSLGLGALGMTRGDRIAILSESRPEWLFADLAVLAAGAITTPIYPTLLADQVGAILRDSEASMAVVSNRVQLEKVLAADAPALRTVVVIEPAALSGAAGRRAVVSLAEAADRGHRRILDGWGVGRAFHDEARRVRPDDAATLIYTSGTTGPPKGVLLTHGNLIANLAGICAVLDLNDEDVALSFLPLCHAFERIVAYVYLVTGVSMVFAESIETIARDLKLVRPTVMTAVPRVFEKTQTRILAAGRELRGASRLAFDWAMRVARRRGEVLPEGGSLSPWLRMESALAERYVFRRVRDELGGRLRFVVSGGAALPPDVGRLFFGLGLPILEGYGLTETAPVLCVMPLGKVRFGTVGRALPNVELRADADGEILARGPNVMTGYYKRPEDTAEVIRDGWFHTGDIGTIDADGYLRITDRKREFLVTSGAKKIAPQPIEAALKEHALVAEAVVIGDGRRFPAALVVPDFAELGRALGVPTPSGDAAARTLIARPDVLQRYQQVVDAVNARLAQFERIKRFALLPRELSGERGELTPTLKVKRRVVLEHFGDVVEEIYKEEA